MFCGKCGAKIDDKSKFCGKCGTKVNKPENAVNTNSLDSFIGNIVKKTSEQSMDSDIFVKIEEEAKKDVNKTTKKISTKLKKGPKAKKKSKPKSKPRPKTKNRKKVQKNDRKKVNIKILIPAILLPLLIISGIFIFNFFRNNIMGPNRYVAKAVSKTVKQIEKYTEKTSSMPDLSLKKNSENIFPEREIYLKIKNSKGGLINEDILGNLKGLSIKTNEKYNIEKELFNAKLTFANNKKEEIYGEIFSSPELATIKSPDLYSDTLGIHFTNDEDITLKSEYNEKISQFVELLTEYESTYNEYKNSIKDKSGTFIDDIVKNAEFIMENENEESGEREYITVLDNKYLLESLKTFLTEIKDEEFNKKVQLYLPYIIKGESLELVDILTGNTDKLITDIDNAIESDIVENVEIKFVINKDQIINSVSFNTVIDRINISVKIDIEDKENSLDQKINIELLNADKYLALDIISSIEELNDNEISRKNILNFTTFFDDKIMIEFNELYNTKTNNYNNNIDFDIDSQFENFSADYNLKGKYKTENDLKRLDIDSLILDIKTALYKFNFEFEGYVQRNNSSSIEEINLNNVIFMDNMSNQEIDDIKTEIYKNWIEFLDLFRERKW